jgi:hypothetical protein
MTCAFISIFDHLLLSLKLWSIFPSGEGHLKKFLTSMPGDIGGLAVTQLRFHVLGPVELIRDDEQVPLSTGLTALLAGLATSPNRVVPFSRLIEGIWGDRPPDHPKSALQSLVSRFRKLADGSVIKTCSWGN